MLTMSKSKIYHGLNNPSKTKCKILKNVKSYIKIRSKFGSCETDFPEMGLVKCRISQFIDKGK